MSDHSEDRALADAMIDQLCMQPDVAYAMRRSPVESAMAIKKIHEIVERLNCLGRVIRESDEIIASASWN